MQLCSADLKTTDFIVKNKVMSVQNAKSTPEIFCGQHLFYEMEAPGKSGAIKGFREGIILRIQGRSSGDLVKQNSWNPEEGVFNS